MQSLGMLEEAQTNKQMLLDIDIFSSSLDFFLITAPLSYEYILTELVLLS